MNAYLINDGGDHKVWKGATMHEATKASEDSYIGEVRAGLFALGVEWTEDMEHKEREHYRVHHLESCTLLGEMGN